MLVEVRGSVGMARGTRNAGSTAGEATAPSAAVPVVPTPNRAATAAPPLDPDLAQLSSWTVEELMREIQAQREHLAELSDFLQVLQDDNHVKDPAFATQVLESLKKMEQRLERWETEFAKLLT
jgi:hypothetical protein